MKHESRISRRKWIKGTSSRRIYPGVSKYRKLAKRRSTIKSWMGLFRMMKLEMFYSSTAFVAEPMVEEE